MSRAGKLMLISPYTHDQVQLAGHLLKSAQAHGIGHIVVLSGYNVEDEEMPEIGKKRYAQEQLVRESGIPYTFPRACNFISRTSSTTTRRSPTSTSTCRWASAACT